MLLYDNLKDAQDKIMGTICTYNGKAVQVKEVHPVDPEGKKAFKLILRDKAKMFDTFIDDEKFDFRDFNIGYANHGSSACWWYRRPLKQFRQGLRGDQLGYRTTNLEHGARFDFGSPIINMLEDKYSSLLECEKSLKDEDRFSMAFNKNFAVSYSRLHRDYVYEYKGQKIGQSSTLKDFHLLPEFKHLTEALREAIA